MKMYKNIHTYIDTQCLQKMILSIELFANAKRFIFLDLHQGVFVINWNKKAEKVSISVGSVRFQICWCD